VAVRESSLPYGRAEYWRQIRIGIGRGFHLVAEDDARQAAERWITQVAAVDDFSVVLAKSCSAANLVYGVVLAGKLWRDDLATQ